MRRDSDLLSGGGGEDHVSGGGGNDELHPGPGWDHETFGGAGDDTVDVRDGLPESVDCGMGVDNVHADAIDIIDASCEFIVF